MSGSSPRRRFVAIWIRSRLLAVPLGRAAKRFLRCVGSASGSWMRATSAVTLLSSMERPTVVALAPTELSDKQRFVLKQLVEQHSTRRFEAIFALG